MALAPVGGSDTADHPYIPISSARTFRVNNDGTFTPVVNVTAASATYGVQFTFTILASTWDTDGGPPLTAERAGEVDEVCAHPHVVGFRTETDQGSDQVLYNYAVITVGTDDGAITDETRVRMDQLGGGATFAQIDATWKRLQAWGAS
jgi:hypothetical protein